MTDHFTSLTPAAMQAIISKLDQGLELFGQSSGPLPAPERRIQEMIKELRDQLASRLADRLGAQE